ncbi:beta-1,4-glucuronyltransferase 1 isoform X3 [Photinus pyralis]|uniref:Beta-1,4-glucuronyltransferase 1 n=1 Tax=Photinus pyralis TaxID=7054 RepID=A0A1Y1MBJ1_PHOPY|nr:beta-1,4-glucuronyltransferase 1 isoform X3 [Photinus pyralis]
MINGSKWGPRSLCIVALTLLSLYNIFLTAKLMYGQECLKSVQVRQTKVVQAVRPPPPPPICRIEQQVTADEFQGNIELELGRWDNRMLYKLYDRIFVGDKYAQLSEEHLVCLATQSSLERLFSLVQVTRNWSGPISAALFAAGDDEFNLLLSYIAYIRRCFPDIRERVTFHLTLPKSRLPKGIDIDTDVISGWNCMNAENILRALVAKRTVATQKWRTKNPYPQNHLRNLARKNCQSQYVFLTDVDIIPSEGLAEALNYFLKKVRCKKLCAYVIPTYEIDNRVRFPPNKTELVRLAKKGLARPFHQKVFIYNQFATNFSRWQVTTGEDKEAHVSHPVTNFEFLYEPFYVAPDSVPPHDERFIGYGYTRNTQVYEMFVAGYEFLVLSPVFTCHWGLQDKRGRPVWREYQNNLHRKYFETFKKEVFAKYNKDPLRMMEQRKAQSL